MLEYYDGLVIIDNIDSIVYLLTDLFEKLQIMIRRIGYPPKFKSDLFTMEKRIQGMTSLFLMIKGIQVKMEFIAPMFYKNKLTKDLP